jgi:hypothetical protein
MRPVEIDADDDIGAASGKRTVATGCQTRADEEIVDFSLGLPIDRLSAMAVSHPSAPASSGGTSEKAFKSQFKLPNNKKIAKEFDANLSLLDVYIIIAAEVMVLLPSPYLCMLLNMCLSSSMYLPRFWRWPSPLPGPDTSICCAGSLSPRCSGHADRRRRGGQ